ncbi:MAG: hypothetical protein FWF12_09650 [Betaproteobacteria bacterium]|nr:hypothetical protein [Betaproteobacteria bacterium]
MTIVWTALEWWFGHFIWPILSFFLKAYYVIGCIIAQIMITAVIGGMLYLVGKIAYKLIF